MVGKEDWKEDEMTMAIMAATVWFIPGWLRAEKPAEGVVECVADAFPGTPVKFKAWDGDTLRVNLLPCVDSTGAAALYDAVTDTLYHNLQANKAFIVSATDASVWYFSGFAFLATQLTKYASSWCQPVGPALTSHLGLMGLPLTG